MVNFETLGIMAIKENKELVISRCDATGKIVIGQKSIFTNSTGGEVCVFAKNAIQLTDEQFTEFEQLIHKISENI